MRRLTAIFLFIFILGNTSSILVSASNEKDYLTENDVFQLVDKYQSNFVVDGDKLVFDDSNINMTALENDTINFIVDGVNSNFELSENQNPKVAFVGIYTMIRVLLASYQTCSTIAYGMGIPGCGALIKEGYWAIKRAYLKMT